MVPISGEDMMECYSSEEFEVFLDTRAKYALRQFPATRMHGEHPFAGVSLVEIIPGRPPVYIISAVSLGKIVSAFWWSPYKPYRSILGCYESDYEVIVVIFIVYLSYACKNEFFLGIII